MQRFGKVMQKLKPEIDTLKKKYPNDPKRVQTEQMALMQKYGVNPFQMLGCLPMFLQMPIWVALYALLYFMFDIRQEPAFFGVFQLFGEWPFLADLSSADHFFGEFSEPKQILFWNVTGINILPILMGVIFFVQQKYMSPQSMATTPEQESQQKIMRVMMVVLFPLMLYSAPSGLTLYILTSSSVGILESRRIRKHIDNIPLEPVPVKQSKGQGKKPKDKQGRAWADAMEARRKKVQNKAKKRSFKKRD
jgi:YidC/Oxa1 family membrane protein insertase